MGEIPGTSRQLVDAALEEFLDLAPAARVAEGAPRVRQVARDFGWHLREDGVVVLRRELPHCDGCRVLRERRKEHLVCLTGISLRREIERESLAAELRIRKRGKGRVDPR